MEEEYYEDIELNHSYRTRYFDVTEADIISFAREWNPEPYHIDPKEAAKSKIGKIFACGPHLIAICTRLTNEHRPRPRTVAGLGWNDLQFASPAFGGDKLLVEIKVISKRISESDPKFGIVVYALRLLNQHEAEVLTYTVSTLVECKEKKEFTIESH